MDNIQTDGKSYFAEPLYGLYMLNDDLYLNVSLYSRNNTTRLSSGWMTRCIIMYDYLIFIRVLQAVSGRICHTLWCNKGHLWGLGARNPKKTFSDVFVYIWIDSTSFMVLFLPPLQKFSQVFNLWSETCVCTLSHSLLHKFDKWF